MPSDSRRAGYQSIDGGVLPETIYNNIKGPGPVTVLSLNEEKTYGSFKTQSEPLQPEWREYLLNWLTAILLGALIWCTLYLIVHGEVLPPGGLFQLLALVVLAQLAGMAVEKVGLPSLIGMLLTGIIIKTLGFFDLYGVYPDLVVISRNLALSVILIKAGLGLDPVALHKLKFTVLRLAALPCLVEACGAALAANLIFGVPWLWAFLIGFILSPISPAVVVPTLLALKEKGYGEDKGIATLVIASSSIDDILSISFFGVIMSYIFTPGGDMTMSIIIGPLELISGLAGGCFWGILCGFIAQTHHGVWRQTSLIGLGGFVAVVGSIEFGVPGAGPLLAITSSFVANIIWSKREIFPLGQKPVAENFSIIWTLVQPALFGLIGAEVNLTAIEPSLLLESIVILICCLFVRLLACLICLLGIGLSWKEMVFVNLAWLPKATVQAALSPQPLDQLRDRPDDPQIIYAKLLLTTAVLAIIITAPIGSIGISILGPKFLNQHLPTSNQ